MIDPAATIRFHDHVARRLFTQREGEGDRVGLEAEFLVVDDEGRRLLRLDGAPPSLTGLLAALAARLGADLIRDASGPHLLLCDGGGITLEPAGQLEISTPALPSGDEALDALDHLLELVRDTARDLGLRIEARALDQAVIDDRVPLLVRKPRYEAMDRYFARIGPYGRMMMRGTCSLQINLDFGSGSCAGERWRLANMIAPTLNAMFAASPCEHEGVAWRSFRGEIWRRADPSRAGRLYDRPDLDPVTDYLRFAIEADVMLIAEGAEYIVPEPLSFAEWVADPSLIGRPPAAEDWELHLTTLFPEVRPRGWMELRSIDACGEADREIAVGMVETLLYDDAIRGRALALLEGRERRAGSDHPEHAGCFDADVRTGLELLTLAAPALRSARARRRIEAGEGLLRNL